MVKKLFFLILLLYSHQTLMAQAQNLPQLPVSNGDDFVVIAHRGASEYAPENTHSAFRLAIDMQAEMIELDVSLSKDGVPVVVHDETVDRTTDASGLVSSFTLEELRKMETGAWFSEEFAGEPFPTLVEVLAYTKDRIAVNIEVKTEAVTDEARGGIIEKSLDIVKAEGLENQVIFSSFDYRVMKHLEELAPEIPKAILYEKSQSGDKKPSELVKEYRVDAFNCSHRQLSDEWLEDLTSNNIPFFIYTINDEAKMKEIISKGATGIFSDKPDVLKEVVENL